MIDSVSSSSLLEVSGVESSKLLVRVCVFSNQPHPKVRRGPSVSLYYHELRFDRKGLIINDKSHLSLRKFQGF